MTLSYDDFKPDLSDLPRAVEELQRAVSLAIQQQWWRKYLTDQSRPELREYTEEQRREFAYRDTLTQLDYNGGGYLFIDALATLVHAQAVLAQKEKS